MGYTWTSHGSIMGYLYATRRESWKTRGIPRAIHRPVLQTNGGFVSHRRVSHGLRMGIPWAITMTPWENQRGLEP